MVFRFGLYSTESDLGGEDSGGGLLTTANAGLSNTWYMNIMLLALVSAYVEL